MSTIQCKVKLYYLPSKILFIFYFVTFQLIFWIIILETLISFSSKIWTLLGFLWLLNKQMNSINLKYCMHQSSVINLENGWNWKFPQHYNFFFSFEPFPYQPWNIRFSAFCNPSICNVFEILLPENKDLFSDQNLHLIAEYNYLLTIH